jgi:tetratricopeptide (TPR) repeat protein
MRKNTRTKRKSLGTGTGAPAPGIPSGKPNPPGRPGKPALWLRLLAALLSPVLFLGSAELVLRVSGYGYPPGFFVRWRVADRTVYLPNQHYGEHFVPKELSRTPEPCALGPKGASTVRIFVLGGSAAYGDPEPAYGFCRQLELLLNEHATNTSFEVVNAAMTAMNSHVARRIARDCVAQRPDLFLVFMGNNEVVGPYGPPTLPGWLYSHRGFINACITAKKETRVGQLLKNAGQGLRGRGRPEKEWLGMESFLTSRIAVDDLKLKDCYRHFRANLEDIVQTARRCGAGVILCTVPTNLRSCAPFGSQHRPGLTTDTLARWDQAFQEGRAREQARDSAGALSAYEQARQTDDSYADLAFCMGRCLEALGKPDEACCRFTEARDRDVLRFRADSSILQVIRETAQTHAAQGVRLLDLEAYLADRSPDHLLGSDLLVDHVHLSFRGNFLAACAAFQEIRRMMPQAGLAEPKGSAEELFDLCRRCLLYDEHEQYRLAMVMYRRQTLPPFEGQIDHDAEMESLREELVRRRRADRRLRESEPVYLEALRRRPLDTYLILRHGQFLAGAGRAADAIKAYCAALATRPFDMRIRVALAQLLIRGPGRDEAVAVLTSKETPDRYRRKEALLLLGAHCAAVGNIPGAATLYDELGRRDAGNVDILVNQAAVASERDDLIAMKRYLDKALALDPGSPLALTNMGNYYAKLQQPRAARDWFARAVQADPRSPFAHIGLGIQSVRLEQTDQAFAHLTKTVALKPDFVEAYLLLAALYDRAGNKDAARKYAELADLFRPAPP